MKIKKKSLKIFELSPFANFVIENLISEKNVTARGFKLEQLIEGND